MKRNPTGNTRLVLDYIYRHLSVLWFDFRCYIENEEANTDWYHETRRFGMGTYSPDLAGIARLHIKVGPSQYLN